MGCKGKGKKKQFIQVKSEYRTHTLSEIIERGGLFKDYLSLLTGMQIYWYSFSFCFTNSSRGRHLEEAECFSDSKVNNSIRNLLYEASSVRRYYIGLYVVGARI